MKTITFFIVLCLASFSISFSQNDTPANDNSYRTLTKPATKKIVNSGFGNLLTSVGQIKGKPALFIGGGGANIVNQKLFYGGYGTSIAGRVESEIATGETLSYRFRHGGIWVGYIFRPYDPVHLSVSLKGGLGGIQQRLVGNTAENDPFFVSDKIQVLTPEVTVQFNVYPWFRIETGLSYQTLFGVEDNPNYQKKDFNTLMGVLNFSFGWFKDHD